MKKFFTSFAALLAVASTVVALNFGVSSTQAQEVWDKPDCSTNAIIKCGVTSRQDLSNKVKKSKDLQNLYAHVGISRSMIDSGTVKNGLVYKNGNVTVGNDKIVATDAWSVGREYKAPDSQAFKVDGKTYYKRPTTNPNIFQNGLPQTAYIFFDSNGNYVGAIIKGCGNPIFSKPKVEKPKPVYACASVSRIKQSDPNKYVFRAKSAAEHGAKATGFTVDFGDGNNQRVNVERTEGKYAYADVSHTYAKPGTYTVKLTAHFTVNGKTVSHTADNCQKSVTIPEKPTNPGVTIDKQVSTDKKDSGMTKEEALEQARNFKPRGACTTVMTPAVHLETGARYTFTSGCLPDGWVAERNYEGQTDDRTVEWAEHATVAVDDIFRYRLVVKNTGDVDLKDVKVTDEAPAGVQFTATDKGSIVGNSLDYTISTLKVGASDTIIITAKATKDLSTDSRTKNTACVDTPTVSGQPDDCDDATVDTKEEPKTEKVCELESGDTITIKEGEFDANLHSRDFDDCEKEVLGEQAPPKKGETPTVIASTGPAAILGGLFGSSALGLGVTGYIRSRRAISDLLG